LAKLLAESNLKKVSQLLERVNPSRNGRKKDKPKHQTAELKSNFTKEDYILAIKKAKEYIRKGDIYQVNLSQQFYTRTDLSGFEIYKCLRKLSPSYFSAYFDAGDYQILSSSPESFLRLEGDLVTTRPMKGTRPRSQNKVKDIRLKKDLLGSPKDKAELIMIVDLERNDLGRVCSYDSIKVATLRQLEEYNTVFQTTATVCGRLHKDKDRIDLIRACFPGGSITGCPKIRAMEIIEELEPSRRSIYTGSLGYLSFSGNMDLNILIRTILKKGNNLYFSVGGGIVADSEPEEEYRETLVKARAMMEAIKT
jgi:para-aminobenzoate synthetase component 1